MSKRTPPSPVGPQQLADLREAQQRLVNAAAVTGQLEACGHDCQQFRQLIQHYGQQISKMLSVFDPNASKGLP